MTAALLGATTVRTLEFASQARRGTMNLVAEARMEDKSLCVHLGIILSLIQKTCIQLRKSIQKVSCY